MTRAPDHQGPVGRAWRLPATSKPACLAAYLVHRPGAHPAWDCYMICVCHLRAEEGLDAPVLHFPGASHEIAIISLDPQHMPTPDPDADTTCIRYLVPLDMVWQGTMTDDEAERLVLDMVRVIVTDARVSPDSDYAPWWKRTLSNTLKHYRTGGHG